MRFEKDKNIYILVDIRLKTLSEPAVTSSGQNVICASDGHYKAQIFAAFQLKTEIDSEFSISLCKIVFKGRRNLSIFLKP